MKNFPTKIIFIFLLAIIFIIVFFRFLNILSFPDPDTFLEKGELFKFQPGYSLTQTFSANRNNLMKIEFLMRTPGPKDQDVIKMEIADETCSKTIRQGTLEKSFLNSDNLYDFQFSKIPDSNGKKFCLKATFDSDHAASKYIRFFTVNNIDSKFVLKDTNKNEALENRSLSIRLAYKNVNIAQDLNELNQRISQYKPWFLKHYFLYGIVLLFVILSFGLAVILIII